MKIRDKRVPFAIKNISEYWRQMKNRQTIAFSFFLNHKNIIEENYK